MRNGKILRKVDSPAVASLPEFYPHAHTLSHKCINEAASMFARAGNDGGDDPYNFDIADDFGGGGKKKSEGKSKLAGKSSLNKTVGARPSTSSLISQVGSMWRDVRYLLVDRSWGFLCETDLQVSVANTHLLVSPFYHHSRCLLCT